MKECVFCRLVRGELPIKRVYEDAGTLVFMDIAGDVDGHLVVIPKAHTADFSDTEEKTLAEVMRTVKKVSHHLVHVAGYEGVNLLHASGSAAGQSVPHFHLHLIPRVKADGIDAWPKFPGCREDREKVFERIRMM